ncbi:MAG: rhodanese-like domain-containing protein [Chloroflexi bacterium]|nr:rhodanese-like domain-containing protein [Chloroflexota bacterium]
MGLFGRLFGSGGHDGTSVNVSEAHRRQQAGALIVDVRELEEWIEGHVPGAKHIPLGRLAVKLHELPRDCELLLLCRSGNRSGVAVSLLQRHGFSNVCNVAGGIVAWERAGLPTQR